MLGICKLVVAVLLVLAVACSGAEAQDATQTPEQIFQESVEKYAGTPVYEETEAMQWDYQPGFNVRLRNNRYFETPDPSSLEAAIRDIYVRIDRLNAQVFDLESTISCLRSGSAFC